MKANKVVLLVLIAAVLSLAGVGCKSTEEHPKSEQPKEHPATEHPAK